MHAPKVVLFLSSFEERGVSYSFDILFCKTETSNQGLKKLLSVAMWSGSFPAFQRSQMLDVCHLMVLCDGRKCFLYDSVMLSKVFKSLGPAG